MIHVQAGGIVKLGSIIAQLGQKEARAAVRGALNKTIVTVKAQTAKEIRAKKLIKMSASDLKQNLFTRQANRGDIKSMSASMRVASQAIPLGRFWARKVKPPVGKKKFSRKSGTAKPLFAVQVKVFGRTQLAGKGNAFLVNRKGGELIFMREGKNRLPVKKLWGPSVADMFDKTEVAPNIQSFAAARFNTVLAQEVNYRIQKLSSKPLR